MGLAWQRAAGGSGGLQGRCLRKDPSTNCLLMGSPTSTATRRFSRSPCSSVHIRELNFSCWRHFCQPTVPPVSAHHISPARDTMRQLPYCCRGPAPPFALGFFVSHPIPRCLQSQRVLQVNLFVLQDCGRLGGPRPAGRTAAITMLKNTPRAREMFTVAMSPSISYFLQVWKGW